MTNLCKFRLPASEFPEIMDIVMRWTARRGHVWLCFLSAFESLALPSITSDLQQLLSDYSRCWLLTLYVFIYVYAVLAVFPSIISSTYLLAKKSCCVSLKRSQRHHGRSLFVLHAFHWIPDESYPSR